MTIYHKHHIIPKHIGGTDDETNLITLTIEEHAKAHKKLYEEHGRWQDKVAWLSLSKQITCAEAIKLSQIYANLGKKHTETTKNKLRNHNLGKKLSKETKLKQSLANKGKIPHNKGIPNTEQQKFKISNKLSKLWEIVYPDGTIQLIKNMDKFCKENNLFKSNMYKVSYGKQKHHKGFTCKSVQRPT
jgi:hypothetical protein